MLDKTEKKKIVFFLNKTSFFRKMSHSAEKVKGGPLGFVNIHSVAKYQKTRRGDSFETSKIFRKKSHSAEKIEMGDPIVSSAFVGYVKRVKKDRWDPLHWQLARRGLRP